MPQIVTRFAPSPTGYLHIGGARTALFNWLFARHHGGQFLLRIEDTDLERSTDAAREAIFEGLNWLGLDHDGDAVSQAAQANRHRAVAQAMLDKGTAYRCYATQDEISAFREAAKAEGRSTLFRSPWRDANIPAPDAPFVVRLKAPLAGETLIEDAVQGTVRWRNDTLDDLVLLRSDGSPTYMLAVVVDDHDMGVTHVIRGDDHLTNAARQTLIYQAMDWDLPVFAHIPLIHGPDGKKMSKRHGAVGVEAYRDLGYPAEAMRNYLARLGWAHGDDEFFTTNQAIEWFTLEGIGKSAARFDFKKLDHISGQHIRAMDDAALLAQMEALTGPLPAHRDRFEKALPALKERAKSLIELRELGRFAYAQGPLDFEEKARAAVGSVSIRILKELTTGLTTAKWELDALEQFLREFASENDLKLGKIAQPLRASLTGQANSPGVFHVMETIGREETVARLQNAAARFGTEG